MNKYILEKNKTYVSQIKKGKLLNPRIDSTFKALFTQNTEESKGALKAFIEAVVKREVNTVELVPNVVPIDYIGQRDINYDILCRFQDGQVANIEMQAFNQNYDYGSRAEYYVARLETTYFKKGNLWNVVPQVYQINVANFKYPIKGEKIGADSVISYFSMRTEGGRELGNRMNIILIELPKVEKLIDNIERNTALENWAIFLYYADDLEKESIIKEIGAKEEGIMKAQQSLSNISADEVLWARQFAIETYEIDRRSEEDYYRREREDIKQQREDIEQQRGDIEQQRNDIVQQRNDIERERFDINQQRNDIVQQKNDIERERFNINQQRNDIEQQNLEIKTKQNEIKVKQNEIKAKEKELKNKQDEIKQEKDNIKQERNALEREKIYLKQQLKYIQQHKGNIEFKGFDIKKE